MDTQPVATPPEPAAETPATPNLAMDVVAAPVETPTEDKDKQPTEDKAPKAPAQPKTPRDKSVTIAITLAVLAILGLSALAVLAYVSSK